MDKLTALLIVDVQNGLFNIKDFPIHNEKLLIKNIQTLLRKAREAKIPVFYIQHNDPKGQRLENGTENWEIHSEIEPKDKDIIIQKKFPDSFLETLLDDELKKHKIKRLVITGLATDMCIDTTVRSAFSHGYKVILIQDAHSTMDSEILKAPQIIAHHNNILQSFSEHANADDFEFQIKKFHP
ncbi:MAG: cysteine hydrolase family protein [Candidatus Hermodarchaeota archaeon]